MNEGGTKRSRYGSVVRSLVELYGEGQTRNPSGDEGVQVKAEKIAVADRGVDAIV